MIHLTTHEIEAPLPPEGKFLLGLTVTTPSALANVPAEEMQAALFRHHHGDWGEVEEIDRLENERGLRLLSVFYTKAGVKFYVITEHDRSATTVLLPDKYSKTGCFHHGGSLFTLAGFRPSKSTAQQSHFLEGMSER